MTKNFEFGEFLQEEPELKMEESSIDCSKISMEKPDKSLDSKTSNAIDKKEKLLEDLIERKKFENAIRDQGITDHYKLSDEFGAVVNSLDEIAKNTAISC